ncbi:MAG: enolase C-terminal domain-like protein [Candidatus Latescibacterota bacterium]
MQVTRIEVHDVTLEYEDWLAYPLNHYYGPCRRTVYVAHTDTGLEGLGESGARESEAVVQRYVRTSPFDWVGDETSLGLGTAMYDLMGKAAGVPVYKLFGQRHRAWVPAGSWTVSTHPRHMAQAVQEYAARGYTWLKYHLSPFENVFAQTEAMQAVAPPGFRVHYDFTMHGTDDHMPELLHRLEQYPIAGCFEDPLPGQDLQGYRELRQHCHLPIVLHHGSMTYEVALRPADAYMLGHSRIGDAVRRAGLFAATNTPFMLQNVGGNITRAMVVHMMAAFPSATFHFHGDTETWKSDVVQERLEPVNGFVRVPEGPGLGVTLERAELERLERLRLPAQGKWILRSHFANGTRLFALADPANSIFMCRPDMSRMLPMRYDAPIQTEYWDDDGSPEYRALFARLERERIILER